MTDSELAALAHSLPAVHVHEYGAVIPFSDIYAAVASRVEECSKDAVEASLRKLHNAGKIQAIFLEEMLIYVKA